MPARHNLNNYTFEEADSGELTISHGTDGDIATYDPATGTFTSNKPFATGELTTNNNTLVRAHLSADQSYLTANGFVPVEIDTADADRRGEFDSTNNQVTVDNAGVYVIGASVRFDTASAGDGLGCRIVVGGDVLTENFFQAGDAGQNSTSSLVSAAMSAGGSVEITARNANNDDTIIGGHQRFTNLSVVKVA